MARGSGAVALEHAHMYRHRVERLSLDLDLMIARRRADACMPGSPAWDAAMGLVEELEEAVGRLGETSDQGDEPGALAPACN